MTAAIDAAAAHFGRIDHVLANAGIASYGTVRQIDEASFDRVIDINITGVYRTLHAAIPHLEETKGYALVVASLASFANLAGLASYNASKAGAESLALVAKQEVAHLGIGVGVCHPSWIDTDIVRGAETDLPTFKAIRSQAALPGELDDVARGVRRGDPARPREAQVAGLRAARRHPRQLVQAARQLTARLPADEAAGLEVGAAAGARGRGARPVPARPRADHRAQEPRLESSWTPAASDTMWPSRAISEVRNSGPPCRPTTTTNRVPSRSLPGLAASRVESQASTLGHRA